MYLAHKDAPVCACAQLAGVPLWVRRCRDGRGNKAGGKKEYHADHFKGDFGDRVFTARRSGNKSMVVGSGIVDKRLHWVIPDFGRCDHVSHSQGISICRLTINKRRFTLSEPCLIWK